MSIWGSGPALVGYQPIKPITTETVHSSSTTPEYSQSLNLESTMLLSSGMNLSSPNCMPTTVIAGQDRQPVCESQQSSSTIIPQQRSINPRQGRRNKSFVDPCEIAPLKKRRIQLQLLNPDERDKVLSKREKNKVAAEKCRVKRREKMQHVRVEYEEYLVANESLERDIQDLQDEKDELERLLKCHRCIMQQKVSS